MAGGDTNVSWQDLARAMQPWTQLARMGHFGVLHGSLSVPASAFPSTVHDSVGMQ